MSDDDARPLILRLPLPGDEAQARAAQEELAADDFDFLLAADGRSWDGYLADIQRIRLGHDLPPDRVRATMLFAVVDEQIVGRVHIRHELTPGLLREGGHIGYGVRPAFRRRGHATRMLRAGLRCLGDLGVERALVTCDDDNRASAATIERNSGVLHDVVSTPSGGRTRRYWIETTCGTDATT